MLETMSNTLKRKDVRQDGFPSNTCNLNQIQDDRYGNKLFMA